MLKLVSRMYLLLSSLGFAVGVLSLNVAKLAAQTTDDRWTAWTPLTPPDPRGGVDIRYRIGTLDPAAGTATISYRLRNRYATKVQVGFVASIDEGATTYVETDGSTIVAGGEDHRMGNWWIGRGIKGFRLKDLQFMTATEESPSSSSATLLSHASGTTEGLPTSPTWPVAPLAHPELKATPQDEAVIGYCRNGYGPIDPVMRTTCTQLLNLIRRIQSTPKMPFLLRPLNPPAGGRRG